MAFISSVNISGINVFLSTLQSFLVSTVGWTLVDTAVSGLPENFVVRSSGLSGDRLIYLKFGASSLNQSGISVFACVSFNSTTDVASNATSHGTTLYNTFHLNSGESLLYWFEADLDHVQIFSHAADSSSYNRYIYMGLVNEIRPIVSATPTWVIVFAGLLTSNNGKIVETQVGTFNINLAASTFTNAGEVTDPNLNDGLVYMWPVAIYSNADDRMFGTLKNAYQVGGGLVDLTNIVASAVDYTVCRGSTLKLAVKMA